MDSGLRPLGWQNVPTLSGEQFAWVLRRAGLDVVLDGPDRALVKQLGTPLATIPFVERLRPELVVAVAKSVGLTPEQFLECIRDLQ